LWERAASVSDIVIRRQASIAAKGKQLERRRSDEGDEELALNWHIVEGQSDGAALCEFEGKLVEKPIAIGNET
jgi:hypothetical protein